MWTSQSTWHIVTSFSSSHPCWRLRLCPKHTAILSLRTEHCGKRYGVRAALDRCECFVNVWIRKFKTCHLFRQSWVFCILLAVMSGWCENHHHCPDLQRVVRYKTVFSPNIFFSLLPCLFLEDFLWYPKWWTYAMNIWSSLSDVLQHEMHHEVLLGLAFELIGNCSLSTLTAAVPTLICCTLGRIHSGILRERHGFFQQH